MQLSADAADYVSEKANLIIHGLISRDCITTNDAYGRPDGHSLTWLAVLVLVLSPEIGMVW